ncbi:tetratricopeptide repeat protein [Microvirga sp. c23x22]|uniref:Tetratricopeptide repeat protein n=2 Tax=Microvirga terricola TaxID=2719797 RepID=A0ABX0VBD1_9HYPH|nr:tetratricopeptide repeat protein [Microvirga terricola]
MLQPLNSIAWVFALSLGLVGAAFMIDGGSQPLHAETGGETYVGSATCMGCHATEANAWRTSQHARAMQEANDTTVLGDFNDAFAEHYGSKARFFRKDGRFVVETDSKDGKTAAFTVKYTFGLEPLQQYLVEFPDGRLQALPFAWDTRKAAEGGQRWFHLYPDTPMPHTDPLHWTGLFQNWNYMCAECHSTNVKKGYDSEKNTFHTTFSEISLGCESCHGPASGHLAWANGGQPAGVAHSGFASVVTPRAPITWFPDPKTGSPANTVPQAHGGEVEMCARCHARRGQFSDAWRPGRPLADTHLPTFLTADLFEADGQMRDEVYNYASFLQSKMYAKGVVCTDCHDPHSGKLKAAGAEVCSQCHRLEKFATIVHTGHAAGPSAPDCISCHMPDRTYMVVDKRHDHSFRIPRPDLSVTLNTPNACNDCHTDKTAAWSSSAVERWHGPTRKGFQTYAEAFHAARQNRPEARELLLKVAQDGAAPAIARGTALIELNGRPSAEVDSVIATSLSDPDPMVRIAALRGVVSLPPDQRGRRVSPLLSDPVQGVRIAAALALAGVPATAIPPESRAAFERAAEEYVASERFNADRPESRNNLAGFFARQGKTAEAEAEYLAAIKLAPASVPARVNLADLYRTQGRDAQAEQLLRSAISVAPEAAAPRHALGLTLVRLKRYPEALEQLRRAAELEANNARYAYVYAVALQSAGQPDEARRILEQALGARPDNAEILAALMQDSLRQRDIAMALGYAERLRILTPDDLNLSRLIGQLKQAPKP